MIWNPKDPKVIDEVRRLIDDGYSAALIAERIDGATKNAVIGMCRRNKIELKGRPVYNKTGQHVGRFNKSVSAADNKNRQSLRPSNIEGKKQSYTKDPGLTTKAQKITIPSNIKPKTLMNRPHGGCCYIVTNESPWLYCSKKACQNDMHLPYCQEHYSTMYPKRG